MNNPVLKLGPDGDDPWPRMPEPSAPSAPLTRGDRLLVLAIAIVAAATLLAVAALIS